MTHNHLICDLDYHTKYTSSQTPFCPSVGHEVYDFVLFVKTLISAVNFLQHLVNSSRVASSKVLPFENIDGIEGGKVVAEAFTSIIDVGSILLLNPFVFTRCC